MAEPCSRGAATGKAHLRPKGHDVDAQPVALLRIETLQVAEQTTCALEAACEHVTCNKNVHDRITCVPANR